MVRNIDFSPEWQFKTSRSSGSGGQHVNKTESRVELFFDIRASALLSEGQKARISEKLANRISQEGVLQLSAENDRSQHRNKDIVIGKFYDLLEKALKVNPRRKPTKVPRAVKERRLKAKKNTSEKKQNRRKDTDD